MVTPASRSSSSDLAISTTSSFAHPLLYYVSLAAHIQRLVTKDWEPHPLSEVEINTERWGTQQRLARIRNLEVDRQHLLPLRDPRFEHQLFLAHVDYKIHFFRTFRINDLPLEILGLVFRFVAWTAPDLDAGVRRRNSLTSACRHWRTVALDDVNLWNIVRFRKFSQYELCFEYLERARNSPLDIRVNDTISEPLTLEMTTSLVARLFTKLSNIRTLIILIQDWDPALCFINSLLRVGEQGIPLILERFELHRAGLEHVQEGSEYQRNFYTQPMALFGGAHVQSLRHLSANGIHIDWDKSVLQNLTCLDIRRIPLEKLPTLKRFRGMLRKCPTLAKLVLHGAGPQWAQSRQEIADPEPISLPDLRVLVLGHFSTDYAIYLCSQFIALNVVELNLMTVAGQDPSTFFDRLASTTPSVRSLTLHSTLEVIIPETYLSIVKWLRSMPLLAYLRIINMPDNFLDLLLYDVKTLCPLLLDQTKDLICPDLAYLEFHYLAPVRSSNADRISSWARSRTQLGFPLQKIFTGTETVIAFGMDWLYNLEAALQEEGTILAILHNAKKPPEEELVLRRHLSH